MSKKLTESGNVVELFPNKTKFHEFLEDIEKKYDEDTLRDFICIYSSDTEDADTAQAYYIYWFGKVSCACCLGLCDIAKAHINDYMRLVTMGRDS